MDFSCSDRRHTVAMWGLLPAKANRKVIKIKSSSSKQKNRKNSFCFEN
jgi:hypothetical protein